MLKEGTVHPPTLYSSGIHQGKSRPELTGEVISCGRFDLCYYEEKHYLFLACSLDVPAESRPSP